MPHTWSRIHEYLGRPPGPLEFAMVRKCADDGLAEADDLDWKEFLPKGHDPRAAAEFAKDVAAMANTRGGLIIFGVSDRPVAFKGIRLVDANPDQYAKWVRNLVQPYLTGLELYDLGSDDGGEALFVVDIPASELAPHSVAFDHTKDQAKAQYASVTPYRSGSHTEWMAEHQIARAYADRLARAADWQQAFDDLRDWTAESLEGLGGPDTAWLIIVGRPTRPIPHSAPRLSREAAKAIIDSANNNPVITFQPKTPVLGLLAGYGYVKVGLNAWVVTNRAREGEQRIREVSVELQHDGSFVFLANLSKHTLRDESALGVGIVNTDVVEQACLDMEALLLQILRMQRIDSPMRVQACVISEANQPLQYASLDFSEYRLASNNPALPRLRPVATEVPAGATDEHIKTAAADLAADILNQFGLGCQLSRYIM
jgi:hypothetical protein